MEAKGQLCHVVGRFKALFVGVLMATHSGTKLLDSTYAFNIQSFDF